MKCRTNVLVVDIRHAAIVTPSTSSVSRDETGVVRYFQCFSFSIRFGEYDPRVRHNAQQWPMSELIESIVYDGRGNRT